MINLLLRRIYKVNIFIYITPLKCTRNRENKSYKMIIVKTI